MIAERIDGWAIATRLRQGIAEEVVDFARKNGWAPGLAVVLVGDNPASQVYVRNKGKACGEVGIRSEVYTLPAATSQADVLAKIDELNADPQVHGILLQLPLPNHLDAWQVIARIAPHKDVDGLHPHNLGLLVTGRPSLISCTPLGCLHLIHSVMPSLHGKRAVVVGRSVLVGRPLALLLGFENATVVQTHSHTVDLAEECQRADILISAVGKPNLITPAHVKPGAVVIDVGINRVIGPDGTASLTGDVDFASVQARAGYITPVPGGVGPMTITSLLSNTLLAAKLAATS